MLHAGLFGMRLDPQTFWAMTPVELAFATGLQTVAGAVALDRRSFEALMRRFPDRGHRQAGAGDGNDAGDTG